MLALVARLEEDSDDRPMPGIASNRFPYIDHTSLRCLAAILSIAPSRRRQRFFIARRCSWPAKMDT